jgi:hypothetical protein
VLGLVVLAGCFPRRDLSEYSTGDTRQQPNALEGAPAVDASPGDAALQAAPGENNAGAASSEATGTPDLLPGAEVNPGSDGRSLGVDADSGAAALDAGSTSRSRPGRDAGVADAGIADAGAAALCSGEGGLLEPDTRHCVFVAATPVSWQQAVADCSSQGSTLIALDTPALDAFVSPLLAMDVWIGAHDPGTDPASNDFIWLDGTPATTTNWAGGEPDAQANQFCVAKTFSPPADPWRDRPCSELKGYVCERVL